MKTLGIIPARFASSRFPGKPLTMIHDKTMIRRVYEQALKCSRLTELIVATDDERIVKEVESFGGKVMMTAAHHHNGTERCAEVASKSEADVIINIQGDEPFIHPGQIDLVAAMFEQTDVIIGTLILPHPLNEELQSPSRVKVVVNHKMQAMYFSRSVIPHLSTQHHSPIGGFLHKTETLKETAEKQTPTFFKHIGIYGYRKDTLMEIVKLKESALEKAEALEQLRWLQNGYNVQCAVTEHDALSIDTPDDLKNLERYLDKLV